nr:MAG TPA: hypothetical protein [Caudoviricetes sp.]
MYLSLISNKPINHTLSIAITWIALLVKSLLYQKINNKLLLNYYIINK